MNDFHLRYFLTIAFALFTLVTLWGPLLIKEDSNSQVIEAAVFKNIDSVYLTPDGPVFRAGAYLQAWPALMHHRMDGVES